MKVSKCGPKHSGCFCGLSRLRLAIGVSARPSCGQERNSDQFIARAGGLPFSDGIVAGNTLYIVQARRVLMIPGKLAGRRHRHPETTAALDNIKKVLKAAGLRTERCGQRNPYISPTFSRVPLDMNKVYKTVMPDPKPARATIQAAAPGQQCPNRNLGHRSETEVTRPTSGEAAIPRLPPEKVCLRKLIGFPYLTGCKKG